MNILIINAGSSSLKYQLIDMSGETILAKGNCERIGIDGQIVHRLQSGEKIEFEVALPSHTEAFEKVVALLTKGEYAVVKNLSEIAAIGHRVVQGGKEFSASVVINDSILAQIEQLSELAPLHNPPAVLAIKACQNVFGVNIPQVAVFDTAFHQTMPPKAYLYGIDQKYYKQYNVRKYGFHGTSHRYVSQRYGELCGGLAGTKIVSCHLGNGSSIAAICDGQSVDTSMGFTPLDGLVMGTRSGAIDPSVVIYLMKKENLTPDQMSNLLNKRSGFIGLSGTSSDARDLIDAAAAGNLYAKTAVELFRYQIRKFIGSYAAAMGGLDTVLFTGGIGENSAPLREEVCQNLEFLGLHFDKKVNAPTRGEEICISTKESKVAVWVMPTNEELMIARDTLQLVK